MISVQVKIEDNTKAVLRAIDKAAYRNFAHAAASIRKAARDSIVKAPKEGRRGAKRRRGRVIRRATHVASLPGQPPHTSRGQIKRAIVYQADKQGAVIGPRRSVLGTAGAAHEHGGAYKGAVYPARPFMLPALESNLQRLASGWAGALGGR